MAPCGCCTQPKKAGTMTEREWLALKSQGKVTGNFSMQETAQIRRRLSQDQGRTWQPTTVFSQKPGSFCRHPILELSNGDWLFPMWYSVEDPHSDKQYGKDYSVVRLSHDRGGTWEEVPVPDSVGRVHMTAVETRLGHLVLSSAAGGQTASTKASRRITAAPGRRPPPPFCPTTTPPSKRQSSPAGPSPWSSTPMACRPAKKRR